MKEKFYGTEVIVNDFIQLAEENDTMPVHLEMRCNICGKNWGISLLPGMMISKRNCVCQRCTTNKVVDGQ